MQYLTYEEFLEIGGNTEIDLAAFNHYIFRVFGIIDNATHNRIENMKEISLKIKHLCCALLKYLVENNSTQFLTSKSQSAGGVSESESYTTKNTDFPTDIQNMIYDYLGSETDDNGTPLLYRGAMK